MFPVLLFLLFLLSFQCLCTHVSTDNTGRYWEMVQRLKVNHFYTSPSAIRKLMKASDTFVEDYELSTLKTIGSGEGLNICILLFIVG